MALFVAANLSAQVKASCNPANCKKTAQEATSGNAFIDLMVAVSNGTYMNEETDTKKPNCKPSACKKAKTAEAKMVATTVEEGKTYAMNPIAVNKAPTAKCDPALCKKICASNPNCSPKDCAKVCAKKAKVSEEEETTKL